MRKLLLLLPMILTTPVLAESDPFGLNRDAYRRFSQHFVNYYQFASVQDWEMACSELRKADAVLKTNFRQLQQYSADQGSEYDWFEQRRAHKISLERDCIPKGY